MATLADITCYDFESQAEAQVVYDALPGDPFGLDTGWPLPPYGDQEAGNGVACDATTTIPELASPGNEEYQISADSAENGLAALPSVALEEATVRNVQYQEAIQTEENPDSVYRIMGIATPEYEIYSDYEGDEVPGQCGAYEATQRLQELRFQALVKPPIHRTNRAAKDFSTGWAVMGPTTALDRS